MKPIWTWIPLTVLLSAFGRPLEAQEYHLFEHPNKQGRHWPQAGLGLRGANVFHEDSISSIVVPDGYRLRIAEHDWLKGYQALIVGYCPFTGGVIKADLEDWDNEINSVSLEKLAPGWNETPEFPTGVYIIKNPYQEWCLKVTGGKVLFGRERFWELPAEATYRIFLLRDEKKGGYTMFSVPSGDNVRVRVDKSDQGTIYSVGAGMYEPESINRFVMKVVGKFEEIPGYGHALCTISPAEIPHVALSTTLDARWGYPGLPHFRDEAKETNQQWYFQLMQKIDVPEMEAVKTLLDEGMPKYEDFDRLHFVDRMSSAFQRKVKSIPFYMAPDRDFPALEQRIGNKYTVTLERQMKLLWPNDGWIINDSSEAITKTYETSTSSTTERSGETRFNAGMKHTTSVEAGLEGIATVTASLEFWADFGMTRSWLNSVTRTQAQSSTYKVPAHSKGALFAVANKLTFRRYAEDDPEDGEIIFTQILLEDQEPNFVARPLR